MTHGATHQYSGGGGPCPHGDRVNYMDSCCLCGWEQRIYYWDSCPDCVNGAPEVNEWADAVAAARRALKTHTRRPQTAGQQQLGENK